MMTEMIDRLKTFFQEKMDIESQDAGSPANQGKGIQIATCAILLEAAMADQELSQEEIAHIHGALRQIYSMDAVEVNELFEMTRRESSKAIDIWQFTNMINQHYSLEQKMILMEHVWKVILSDGTLDKFEDYLARKLKPLLRLDHKQWIETKGRARKSP